MKRFILIPIALLLFSLKAYSQDSLFKTYRPGLAVSERSFSMDIPHSWKEIPGQAAAGYFQSFLETDSAGKPVKKLCLDTVIYRLRHFPTAIPKALEQMGFYARHEYMYLYEVNNFIHAIVSFEMKANNYTGLDCTFFTHLPCEGKKSKKTKSTAQVACLFFSNGAETICLMGNGIALSDEVLERIKSSFKFDSQ